MEILALIGSPRLKGNTSYLVDEALKEASKLGAQTDKLVLSQYDIKPCLGHDNCASVHSCRQKDDVGWILDNFCKADGVILATPVYYYNVSAQMKAFIDRNYFLYKHNSKSRARVVGVIAVAEVVGIEDTLHTLKQFIDESFRLEDKRNLIIQGHAGRVGDVKNNIPLIEEARELGWQMVEMLKEES